MSKVISFANFKGGVGKTSTTALVGYNLAKQGNKVLMIDFDAQANLTSLILKTQNNDADIITIETSLMNAINEDLNPDEVTLKINDNLYLIPNAVDFSVYARFLERNFETEIEKIAFFDNFIEPIKESYDYIFIDVPPTLSLLNDSAFYACDYIVVVLQTQERSLSGAEVFISYLQDTLIDEFDARLDIIGILPVLSKKGAQVDEEILRAAEEEFGADNIFGTKISLMERVKRMDMQGITDSERDPHDKRVHSIFTDVGLELIDRISGE